MSIQKTVKYATCFAAIAAFSSPVFALSIEETEYAVDNCKIEPAHDELASLAAETNSGEKLNTLLAEQFGCPLVMDDVVIDDFTSKFPFKQIITNTGNTRFEGLESCAYHPQREEFVCSLSVRQRFGFAGTPAIGAGSNEWVTICVDYGGGMEVVDTAAVHVHDEQFGNLPNWYYGAVIQGNEKLQAQIQNGQTLRARAILSWATPANRCNYRPVWGNQADFRIKLDP